MGQIHDTPAEEHRAILRAALLSLLAALPALPAAQGADPGPPGRSGVIVGYAPGARWTWSARAVGQQLAAGLGQPGSSRTSPARATNMRG